jgi:hypothetical protein
MSRAVVVTDDELPFSPPHALLSPAELRRIAEAVGRHRDLWDGKLQRLDGETFIHRMRPEPGAGPTVTIHAYSPPLRETGQYAELHDVLLHRVPSDATEQLKPHGWQGTPSTSS